MLSAGPGSQLNYEPNVKIDCVRLDQVMVFSKKRPHPLQPPPPAAAAAATQNHGLINPRCFSVVLQKRERERLLLEGKKQKQNYG